MAVQKKSKVYFFRLTVNTLKERQLCLKSGIILRLFSLHHEIQLKIKNQVQTLNNLTRLVMLVDSSLLGTSLDDYECLENGFN